MREAVIGCMMILLTTIDKVQNIRCPSYFCVVVFIGTKMGNEQSRLVKLVREGEERPIRELIAKHGAGVLTASYEHTDNDLGWPSFGVSLVLFKMSGVCACACACACCDSDN